jgi:hypothetical protein
MSGCPGCLLSERERQDLLNKVVQDAKQDAIKQHKFMVIYDLPDGKVTYMEAEQARAAGITARQFVSYL